MTLRDAIDQMPDDAQIEIRWPHRFEMPNYGEVVNWQISTFPASEAKALIEDETPFRAEVL